MAVIGAVGFWGSSRLRKIRFQTKLVGGRCGRLKGAGVGRRAAWRSVVGRSGYVLLGWGLMAAPGGDGGGVSRSAFDCFAWDGQLRIYGPAASRSAFGFGGELELGMWVCGQRCSIVADWIGCGSHRDVYRGGICGLDDLGALVVKIGTSLREENASLTEWVNFHEHGFSQCITPLVYGETSLEHKRWAGRGGNVTVLVESAVVEAETGLREFFYDLVRAGAMGWDRAVYALGKISGSSSPDVRIGMKMSDSEVEDKIADTR